MVDGVTWSQLIEEAGDEVADSFDPLPEAVYDLEVVEARHTKTKTTPSKDMWAVQYKVIGGSFNNRRIFNNIVLTLDNQKALGFYFRNMGAHGLTRDYFNTNPTNEAIASALKGRRVRAQVVQKPYQGETKNEIKNYRKLDDVATPPVAAVPGGTPPPPVAAAAPPAAPPAAAPPAAAPPAPPEAAAPPAAPAPAAAPPAPPPAAPPASDGAVPPPPPLQGLPF